MRGTDENNAINTILYGDALRVLQKLELKGNKYARKIKYVLYGIPPYT